MKVSYRWLSEFVDMEENPKELASLLPSKGLEVEEVSSVGEETEKFIVAEVIEVSPKGIRVSTGKGIKGIKKDFAGLKPKDKVALSIEKEKIAQGSDLGLEGSLILPKNYKAGEKLSKYLKDWIFDLEIPANRGDLLSIMGIAREIAAWKGRRLRVPKIRLKRTEIPIEDYISLEIADSEANPRYIAKLILDVKADSSPLLIRWRLFNIGVRSVNSIVDVTNYVMFETGQPIHAFDYDKIEGKKIITRWANQGEEIQTIDGVLRGLNPKIYLIADEKRPIAIAGVQGGIETEVTSSTERVLLECANFAPSVIRYVSSNLSSITEASQRFGAGVDPEICEMASLRAASLISGRLLREDLEHYKPKRTNRINLPYDRAKTLLGVKITKPEIEKILTSLNFKLKDNGRGWEVEVPSFRQDISYDADLIEEVARIYGYDEVPSKLSFQAPYPGTRCEISEKTNGIRDFFINYGFSEIKTLSFIPNLWNERNPKPLNPISQRFLSMRGDLLMPGLEVVGQNHCRGNLDLKLFELGKVFLSNKRESIHLAGFISGSFNPEFWKDRRRFLDFFDLKGTLEEFFDWLGMREITFIPSAQEFLDPPSSIIKWIDKETGWLGKVKELVLKRFDINIPVYAFEIDLEEILNLTPKHRVYTPISKFPAVKRDLAFVIDKSIPASELIGLTEGVIGSLLEKIELFDLFEGKFLPSNKRSLGVRLTICSKERTLSNEEVEEVISKVVRAVEDKLKGKLR